MEKYLEFTVIAAIITTIGSLIALFIKDFLFTRYFDNFKEKESLNKIYKRYRDPLVLASNELLRRLLEIYYEFPTTFLQSDIIKLNPEKSILKTTDDEYFRKYKLISTLYRFCSLFGWIELYRNEITFLETHSVKKTAKLLELFHNLKSAIADGHHNKHSDSIEWEDSLIFREELRMIGEEMIVKEDGNKIIMGYKKFNEIFEEYSKNENVKWIKIVLNFWLDCKTEKDFRNERIRLMILSLFDLVEFLDGYNYYKDLKSKRIKFAPME